METVTKTGKISAALKPQFQAKFDALVKRANKLGLQAPTVEWGTGEWEGKPDNRVLFFPVTVTGQSVTFDGWKLIAAVDAVGPDMAIVRAYGEVTEQPRWRTDAGTCDHCGVRRARKMSVVIERQDEQKMVGVDCLRDVLPSNSRSPEMLVAYFDGLEDLFSDDAESDELDMEDGEGGSKGSPYFEPMSMLPIVAELVLKFGYMSGAKAEMLNRMPTSTAANMLWSEKNPEKRLKISPEAEALASASLEWAKALTPENSYQQNLKALAVAGYCDWKHNALLCSMVPAYQRAMAQTERVKFARENSQHVGTVDEKLVVTVRLERVIVLDSMYGPVNLHIFTSETGDSIKWFASGARPPFPTDRFFPIQGKVKRHDEREGVKETTLTRVVQYVEKAPKSRKKAAA